MIYYGNTAKKILLKNLDNYNFNKCLGYFRDKKVWVAFDNVGGNCNVEEFTSEEMAICWLENFFSPYDIDDFEVVKIKSNLFFIPNNGFLRIQFQNSIITTKLYAHFA